MAAAQSSAGIGPTRKFKCCLIGDSGTGKSSLVVRLCKDEFVTSLHSTVGSSFFKYSVNLDPADLGGDSSGNNNVVHFDLWDTAGQERFRSLSRMYYRGAAAVVVVYDITSVETFSCAKSWVKELQSQEHSLVVLVGNKTDLEEDRAVSREEAQTFANEHGIEHFDSSAKSGQGVAEIFKRIAVKLAKTAKAPATAPAGGVRNLAAGPRGGAAPAKKDCAC